MLHFISLGGGFKYFLGLPLPGEMIQFDDIIFCQKGLVQPPSSSPKLPLEEASFPKSIQPIGSHGILKVAK